MNFLFHLLSKFYITDPSPRSSRRRSSASERAKEIEAINCIVSGKNILITGGAAGLGHAFLNHFLKHGANVSLTIKIITINYIKIKQNCIYKNTYKNNFIYK